MTTGERIRQARIQAGLTQKELAQKVGVQWSAIHKYETGKIVNLKRETIAALAVALDVKPSWLMCMEEDIPSVPGLVKEPYEKWADKDARLLMWFRSLPPEKQRAILFAQDAPEDLV